jgi:hypothetical protein
LSRDRDRAGSRSAAERTRRRAAGEHALDEHGPHQGRRAPRTADEVAGCETSDCKCLPWRRASSLSQPSGRRTPVAATRHRLHGDIGGGMIAERRVAGLLRKSLKVRPTPSILAKSSPPECRDERTTPRLLLRARSAAAVGRGASLSDAELLPLVEARDGLPSGARLATRPARSRLPSPLRRGHDVKTPSRRRSDPGAQAASVRAANPSALVVSRCVSGGSESAAMAAGEPNDRRARSTRRGGLQRPALARLRPVLDEEVHRLPGYTGLRSSSYLQDANAEAAAGTGLSGGNDPVAAGVGATASRPADEAASPWPAHRPRRC